MFKKQTLADVLATFDYHKPSDAQIGRIATVRLAAKTFAMVLWQACPETADRTAALRMVHEAMMTANKSIVLDPPFVRSSDCPEHDSRCTAERCILDPGAAP